MDDTKKKRLAALKAETSEYGARPARKQKEKPDLWDELSLNKPVIADKSRTAVAPNPIEMAPLPPRAAISPVISPKAEPVKQESIQLPAERTKIYRWPDGYYLASGKLIDIVDPAYATAERFKIFKPPSGWVAKTEDGTQREYKIEVEMNAWDRAELKRMNKIISHDKDPIIINPYNGVR
jgi:hypothetical protein